MTKGVFIHRFDSIYDDCPAERYHFPSQYLGRMNACIRGRGIHRIRSMAIAALCP